MMNGYTIRFWLLGTLLFTSVNSFSQDPNFYVFLCFGQSNMEGHTQVENRDTIMVDGRFLVLATVDCPDIGRTKGEWYDAIPPLARCRTGLGPADYFGRTMVANLPAGVRVGVINVSIGGCKIELFDKDNYVSYAETAPAWMAGMIEEYGGNPYRRLVEMGKIAQKTGVIKGVLLHQGESNTGDEHWPVKVKCVYDNLLTDLSLDTDSVPLLAGELVHADEGGACASMNAIIATLPQTIPNAHIISSSGCEGTADRLHFSPAGYRELGSRYADKMLHLLGYPAD